MIKVIIDDSKRPEDLVIEKIQIRLDESDNIKSKFESMLEGLECKNPDDSDYPNEVLIDERGTLVKIKYCCKDFKQEIRETISNNKFEKDGRH